jgi:hypothetical protein
MNSDAGHIVTDDLNLAHMYANSDLQALTIECFRQRPGAGDRPGRLFESCEESVSGGIDLAAPEALQLFADQSVVPGK